MNIYSRNLSMQLTNSASHSLVTGDPHALLPDVLSVAAGVERSPSSWISAVWSADSTDL